MQYKNFALKTKQSPYEIIVNFEGDNQSKTTWNRDVTSLEENARMMFSLIGNVDKITFSINREHDGMPEGFQAVLSELFDTSNVGKDIYRSPDGNTPYLDSESGEKTV